MVAVMTAVHLQYIIRARVAPTYWYINLLTIKSRYLSVFRTSHSHHICMCTRTHNNVTARRISASCITEPVVTLRYLRQLHHLTVDRNHCYSNTVYYCTSCALSHAKSHISCSLCGNQTDLWRTPAASRFPECEFEYRLVH